MLSVMNQNREKILEQHIQSVYLVEYCIIGPNETIIKATENNLEANGRQIDGIYVYATSYGDAESYVIKCFKEKCDMFDNSIIENLQILNIRNIIKNAGDIIEFWISPNMQELLNFGKEAVISENEAIRFLHNRLNRSLELTKLLKQADEVIKTDHCRGTGTISAPRSLACRDCRLAGLTSCIHANIHEALRYESEEIILMQTYNKLKQLIDTDAAKPSEIDLISAKILHHNLLTLIKNQEKNLEKKENNNV